MIMGNSVRYRLGTGGLIGVGLLALAALPGCSTGQAADEFVATDGINISAPADPGVIQPGSTDFTDPQPPLFQTAQESAPTADPFTPAALPPGTASEQELPARADPIAPAVELPAVSPPAKSGVSSTDERIQRLEERFDALLKELRESKNPALPMLPKPIQNKDPNATKASVAEKIYRTMPPKAGNESSAANDFQASHQKALSQYSKEFTKKSRRADGETERVELTRATYKLTAGRSQAIAAFLTQNLSDEIEVRVKGDGLQVTASEEDQTAIGHFIRLLQTRGAVEPKPATPKSDASAEDNFKPATPKGF